MKKFYILLFVALCSIGTFAQKGSWYIGGQVGYNSGTEEAPNAEDITTNSYSVAPEVGTFLQNDLQLGFALNYGGSTVEQGDAKTTTSSFAPVLYLRKFYKVADQFSVFAGIVGSYMTGSEEQGDFKRDITGWSANISLGAAFALSSRFTAVGQYGLLGYSTKTTKHDSDEVTESNLGLNINSLGPVFNVGIYYTL